MANTWYLLQNHPDIDTSILDEFPDKDEIAFHLQQDITMTVHSGLMGATERGFAPQRALTRAEACLLIYRVSLN